MLDVPVCCVGKKLVWPLAAKEHTYHLCPGFQTEYFDAGEKVTGALPQCTQYTVEPLITVTPQQWPSAV